MTLSERQAREREALDRFYSTPELTEERTFLCYHQPNRPQMRAEMCRARALKPSLYSDRCSGCPKWKKLRRAVLYQARKERLNAEKPIRIPYL